MTRGCIKSLPFVFVALLVYNRGEKLAAPISLQICFNFLSAVP
ncbi:hypothetical protein HMPREF0262_03009 [Clostridium sp. ATCC 29733]|nr:hypothetical protein HMPREF0262_03009 [Clostridium sp. ATCC 29733]